MHLVRSLFYILSFFEIKLIIILLEKKCSRGNKFSSEADRGITSFDDDIILKQQFMKSCSIFFCSHVRTVISARSL